jgi:hypothetical protein
LISYALAIKLPDGRSWFPHQNIFEAKQYKNKMASKTIAFTNNTGTLFSAIDMVAKQ